jgi:hypothetical protein
LLNVKMVVFQVIYTLLKLMLFGENYVRVLKNITKPTDTQKIRAIPLQSWTCHEVCRSLGLTDFKRIAI